MPILDEQTPAFVQSRKGISTPALLVTITIAMLLAAAAINLAQLSHQRHQIQIGADAAALAATAQLHDARWLQLGPEGSDASDMDQRLAAVQLNQLEAAQRSAVVYAGYNKVAYKPIVLEENSTNAIDGDLVFGFVADPATRKLTGTPGPTGEFNSMVVRASRRKAAGDLPLLWMARHVGLTNLDMKVYSQAVVDQRVYGFRPLAATGPDNERTNRARTTIPMLPFAVIPNTDDLRMFPPTAPPNLWWAKGPQDDFTADPLRRTFAIGGDGIAEMVIRIGCNSNSGSTPQHTAKTRRGAFVGFGSGSVTSDAILHFSRFGLAANDIPRGEINLSGAENLTIFPAEYNLEDRELRKICEELIHADPPVLGAPRILPIGAAMGGANSNIAIVGFVAGTIVRCEQDPGDGSLLIVVQPCLLQTPTALTGGDSTPRNPWIGKLLLNR